MAKPTYFELTHGCDKNGSAPARYFEASFLNDAFTRFSYIVRKYDIDKDVHAAWVHLKRLPDDYYEKGINIAGWTKTSDERPTFEGILSIPDEDKK